MYQLHRHDVNISSSEPSKGDRDILGLGIQFSKEFSWQEQDTESNAQGGERKECFGSC